MRHLYLLLVMGEDQILTYKVARFWFAILSCYSGLFGLYDLGIQTKVNFWWISSKWPQTNEKSIKFWFLIVSGLWFGLHDLHWPFAIFLRSLMPKKSSGMQQSYMGALFHQKQFSLEISHFGSVCWGPSLYGFAELEEITQLPWTST